MKVEVGIELGTIIDIPENTINLKESVKYKIIEKLNIDNKDVILNDIIIYNWNDISNK